MGMLYAIFITFFVALFSLATVGNALQREKVITQEHAAQYLLPSENNAKALAQAELDSDVQNGISPTSILASSTPAPVCASSTLPNAQPCPFKVVTHATLAGQSGTTASYSGNDSCNNANATIGEECESFVFTTQVTDATSGAVLASRASDISYRLITKPIAGYTGPYAILAGQATSGATENTAETDIGGCDSGSATTSTCGANDGSTGPLNTINYSYTECTDGYISCTGVPATQRYVNTTTNQNEQYNSSNQSTGTWAH